MALIGNIYVTAEEEEIDSPVSVSTHPMETGVDITDHVRAEPMRLSITGKINGDGYRDRVSQLRHWQSAGMVVNFIGRNVFTGAQITDFSTTESAQNAQGCDFTMTLQQARVAQNVFWTQKAGYDGDMLVTVKGNDGTVQVVNLLESKQRFHTLMAGETLWFVASQYRASGVSVESLQELNRDRDVFQPGQKGNFEAIRTGAQLLLGIW